MSYDENNERTPYRSFRSTLDLGMGVLYLVIASAILSLKYFGTMELSSGFAYVLGGLMFLYGAFRIYRGIRSIRDRNTRR
ncbi:MAG: hypothetical protein JSS96_06050 [Bacteroidetes bacterium]|nr:hypothetical protein [Bacteroidota bacterium]